MSIKGYPSQEKDDRFKAQFPTIEPIREKQFGQTVNASVFCYSVGNDAAEAGSTVSVVVATTHAARQGDVIRFTSGTHSSREVKIWEVDTDSITLAETLSSAVGVGDTFEILRPKYPVVESDGSLATTSGPIQFLQDGNPVEVTEDTVTPANNIPLPVKLTGFTGDVTITADQLDVQLSHLGGTPDSVQIGDGIETASVTAANQLEVAVTASLPGGTNNIGDVDVLTLPPVTATDLDIRDLVFATDKVDISGSTVALDAPTLAALESITVENGNGASAVNIQDGGNSITVDGTVAATQSGPWDITNISGTVSLPTGASTEATLSALSAKFNSLGQNTMVNSAPVVIASDQTVIPVSDNAGSLTVDGTVAATQSGSWTVTTTQLDTVDFIDGTNAILDASSTNIPGSAGSPVTLVASLAANISAIQALDTTGGYIGIYTGPAASEVLQVVVGPGSDTRIEVGMTSGQRVSAKRLDSTTALSSGFLAINFLG